jgi:hypothetical protein
MRSCTIPSFIQPSESLDSPNRRVPANGAPLSVLILAGIPYSRMAVGMLPFVIPRPDYRYPISVFLGTLALILFCFGYSRLLQWIRLRKNAMSVS